MGKSIKNEFDQLISTISLEIMKEKPLKSFHLAVDELKTMGEISHNHIKDVNADISEMKKVTKRSSETLTDLINNKKHEISTSISTLNDEIALIKKKNSVLLIISAIQFVVVTFLAFKMIVG